MAERDRDSDPLRLQLLVLRCQTGDEQALASLMGRFGGRTLAHLRALVGDDAEDVQQEVWLAVYRDLRTLHNPRAFRTWLFRTTRHRAIDFLRARKRDRELIDDVASDATSAATPAVDHFVARLDESAVGTALARLAPLQREVLVLRYEQDLSYGEIALVMGCSIGTVRSRLHYAMRGLRELLGEPGPRTR